MGRSPPQSALEAQPTHVPEATWQIGVAPMQAFLLVAEHWPQAPLVWQAGRAPPQSRSVAHATQAWAARSQTGVAPPHWAEAVQPTQAPAATSQTARGVPAQAVAFAAEHSAQAPLVWHAGAEAGHSPSLAQARHV
jgi:hypothetical protein